MDNKILFRGFHADENGETVITIKGEKIIGNWVYGYPVQMGKTISMHVPYDKVTDNYEIYMVIPKTVGQFVTTDKNGKDLFEGDIVQGTIVSQWSKSLIRCEIVRKEYEFVCIEHTANRDWSHQVKFAKDIELISNKWEYAK